MYTNSGNRILTKYSDFLKQTQGSGGGAGDFPIDTEELPDSFNKKRVNSTSSSISSASFSNFSGRTNSSTSVHGNCRTSHSTVNAQVHQIDEAIAAAEASAAPGPPEGEFGESNTSKFSDLFSPSESNALYMRNQLINSEDGKFLQEAIPNYKKELVETGNSQIDIGSQIPLAAAAAVPLLPPQYSTTSLQHSIGSGGSSSLNPDINSVTLRRELLNNIRAISKATFFEDLYVNNGNPGNTQSVPASTSFPELPESNSRPQTIVSERGEYLVFETQLPNLPSSPSGSNGFDQTKLASIDEWIRNSQENLQSNHSNPPISEENPTNSESEIFQEENDKSMQIETDNFKSEQPKVPDSYSYTNYRTMKSVDVENIDKLSQPDFTPGESQSQVIAKVPDSHTSSYNFTAGNTQNGVTMTTNTNSSESTVVKVPSPETEDFVPNTGATLMHDLHMHDVDELLVNTVVSPAPSTPNSLTNSSTTSTNKTQTYNNPFPKVHYPTVLPTPTRTKPRQRQPQPLYGVPLPGILRRQNMDQWVAKILRFYINGDEHAPKYEFRFRPGRDVRSWDGLCDTLSERLQLSRGVRWIFTLDGQLVQSLDQLRHGRAYVVSSNKKFKALNYGGEVEGSSGNEDSDDQLQPIHRPPSAPPNQKHPPVIRVRRERSLHGVSWGSPQQLSNTSGSETNNNNNLKSKIPQPNTNARIGAAESVVQAAIDAASSRLGTRVTLPLKQIVRIINGTNPTVQSQVLLNTRVSQDWNDLVKDLGLSVKIPRSSSSRLETIVGRQIQSYSQLRSELKVGNNAFYIYVLTKNGEKKLPKMDDHIKIGAGGGVGRSSSHPTIYQASNKTPNVGKLGRIGNQSNNSNQKSNSISTPNLSTTMKLNNPPLNVKIRKSHRKRTEASTYLVPNHHIIRDTDRSP